MGKIDSKSFSSSIFDFDFEEQRHSYPAATNRNMSCGFHCPLLVLPPAFLDIYPPAFLDMYSFNKMYSDTMYI